jgi:hypothetical protein
MTKKFIPGEGEEFKGYIPAVKKVLHVTYGPSTTNDVVTSDCGVYTLVDVGLPIMVFSVKALVETAFTASVTGTLGDTASADRYMVAGTLGDTVVDTALQADSLAAPFWDTAGLDINVTIAGAVPAVGLAHIFVEYAEMVD